MNQNNPKRSNSNSRARSVSRGSTKGIRYTYISYLGGNSTIRNQFGSVEPNTGSKTVTFNQTKTTTSSSNNLSSSKPMRYSKYLRTGTTRPSNSNAVYVERRISSTAGFQNPVSNLIQHQITRRDRQSVGNLSDLAALANSYSSATPCREQRAKIHHDVIQTSSRMSTRGYDMSSGLSHALPSRNVTVTGGKGISISEDKGVEIKGVYGVNETSHKIFTNQMEPRVTHLGRVEGQPHVHVSEYVTDIRSSNMEEVLGNHYRDRELENMKRTVKLNNEANKEITICKQEIAVLEKHRHEYETKYKNLTVEKEHLVLRLKDSEMHNHNILHALKELESKFNNQNKALIELETILTTKHNEKVALEIEVKQLTERVRVLESLLEGHEKNTEIINRQNTEIQRLNEQINQLKQELMKFRGLDQNSAQKMREMEMHIRNLESQLKSGEGLIADLKMRLSSISLEIESLVKENNRLNHEIATLTDKNGRLSQKNIKLESEITELKHLNQKLGGQLEEKDRELNRFSTENINLQNDLKTSFSEITILKKNFEEMDVQFGIDIDRANKQNSEMKIEIERLMVLVNESREASFEDRRLREEADRKIQGLLEDIAGERKRREGLEVENVELRDMINQLKSKIMNIERERDRLRLELENGSSQNGELNRRIEELMIEIKGFRTNLSNKENELTRMRTEFQTQLSGKDKLIQELQAKNKSFEAELRTLRSNMASFENQIAELRRQLEKEKSSNRELQNRISTLERENQKLKASETQYMNEINKLKREIQELKTESESLKGQIRTLEQKHRDYEIEIRRLKEKLHTLDREISKLKTENSTLLQQVTTLKTRNSELEEKNTFLSSQVKKKKNLKFNR